MDKIENKIIKNFLSEDEKNLLKDYVCLKHKINDVNFDLFGDITNGAETYFYSDPIFETIMLRKKDLMEKELNKKLLPTYTYWRMYTYGAQLTKHKDRPECEISISVNIGADKKWPIYIDNKPYVCDEGDAVLYFGCTQEHYREKYLGDWCAQAFIHYVDAEGSNKHLHMDKRQYFGLPWNRD